MAAYSLDFGKELIRSADLLSEHSDDSPDRNKTLLYLSLLASEIVLKALLEKAGFPVGEIKKKRHDLDQLLEMMGRCEVLSKDGDAQWIPATGIRSKTISVDQGKSTVGEFLSGQNDLVSRYPNEIRYGTKVRHFPHNAAVEGARVIRDWADENFQNIRTKA